jgi:VWFA-related protein
MVIREAGPGTLRVSFALALTLLFGSSFVAQEQAADPPLDLDIEEHVDVRFVLIDAVVHDEHKATVGGLAIDDFDLLIDNRDVEIASLDVSCPDGGSPDPPVGAARTVSVSESPRDLRRFIFVMDYYHPGATPTEVLEQMRGAIRRLHGPGEEYMLISLGQVLRVEVPFTDDPEVFVRGIDRMIPDSDLYFGYYGRLTERRWYQRILTLLDLTELIPGHKSVVLFSGPFLEDGWNYDESYRKIAAMSGRSRTAFYPVDGRGLVVGASILGPRQLGRLAVETGGLSTAGTNDLGRAFARAQRDQDCRYTVGFYDRRPELDRKRKVRLFVRRSGHRVSHPVFYVLRSDETEYRSWVRTAQMVPSMFPGDRLSVDLHPVSPRSKSRWTALATIAFDSRILEAAPTDAEWTMKGTLRRLNGTIHQKFVRSFTATLEEREAQGENYSVFAEIRPKPGRYVLNVVLSSPEAGMPLATTREVAIPRIPEDDDDRLGPNRLEHAHVVGSAHQLLARLE